MDPTLVLVVVVIAVLIAIGGWYLMGYQHTRQLRTRFGPEYDHGLARTGDKRSAERELETRTRRVQELQIEPLRPDDRARFAESWRRIQAQFVDDPRAAVAAADPLIGDVMKARGYPVADFEQRAADVSV